MRFKIVVKSGIQEVANIEGVKDIKLHDLSEKELEQILKTEALLEELTGLRFHIETQR